MADAEIAVVQVSLEHCRVNVTLPRWVESQGVLQNSVCFHELFQADDAIPVLIIGLKFSTSTNGRLCALHSHNERGLCIKPGGLPVALLGS